MSSAGNGLPETAGNENEMNKAQILDTVPTEDSFVYSSFFGSKDEGILISIPLIGNDAKEGPQIHTYFA
jgi:hypothetical protein